MDGNKKRFLPKNVNYLTKFYENGTIVTWMVDFDHR